MEPDNSIPCSEELITGLLGIQIWFFCLSFQLKYSTCFLSLPYMLHLHLHPPFISSILGLDILFKIMILKPSKGDTMAQMYADLADQSPAPEDD